MMQHNIVSIWYTKLLVEDTGFLYKHDIHRGNLVDSW